MMYFIVCAIVAVMIAKAVNVNGKINLENK